MVRNGLSLLIVHPVEPMIGHKVKHSSGTSYGLGEAGYDIRIKQDILFTNDIIFRDGEPIDGHFCIASTIERFTMPSNLVAIVHDKSTWARQGLSVFNTVIEPGWVGYLTLELVYHGTKGLHIPKGSGIAQVVFHVIENNSEYTGKYQNQEDKPITSIFEKE